MKIAVRTLGEGASKNVRAEYNAKELDLEFVDLTYLTQLKLDGTVEKAVDTLTFRGHMTSQVQHTCARCLKGITEDVDYPFELVYDIRGKEEVDTLDDLREILILDHPIRYLCRENCQGLCPRCGADLNQGPCPCLS